MSVQNLRLPGRTPAQRVLSAVAIYAAFYLVLLALTALSNSWLASGSSFVTP